MGSTWRRLTSVWLPAAAVWGAFVLVTGAFAWILGDLLWHGASQMSWDFLFSAPRASGRAGGIGPILVSTLLIVSTCLAVSVPIGLGTAVLLAEYTSDRSTLGRIIRRSLDVLSGVPSIVFGLFGNAFFCQTLGLGFSILSGGLTLSCMVLPLLIRSTEEGFRSVPREYRTSAAALGLSRATTLFKLLLPAAAPGLIVGVVLSLGRAIAETAVLIFTSGYVDRMPTTLLDSGRSLSLHIFDLSMNVTGGDAAAYKSSLVLVTLLLVLSGLASWIVNRFVRRRIVTA